MMDDPVKSLENSFWHSDAGRFIEGCLGPYKDHKDVILIGVLIFLTLFPFVCMKATNLKHVDEDIGYEIKGPSWWHMSVSPDLTKVKFAKHRNKRSGNTVIQLDIEMSNPYGTTLDYLTRGVLAKAGYQYQKAEIPFRVDVPPYALDLNGREWSTATLQVNTRDVQVFYVTFVNEHILILSLYAPSKDRVKSEKVLKNTLRSIKTKVISRRNFISEKFNE